MRCPHCKQQYDLTWARYWKAPRGHHICPLCNRNFRLKHSFSYYISLIFLALIFSIIPLLVGIFYFDLLIESALLIALLGNMLILLPLDKWFDNRWRGAVALPDV